MKLYLKINAYLRLGVGNVIRVALYRFGLRSGLHPVIGLDNKIGGEQFFDSSKVHPNKLIPPHSWRNEIQYFGWKIFPLGEDPPHWHTNAFNGQQAGGQDQPWWKLSDFALPVGDIKTIWELSRFDWVMAMAQRGAAGESSELVRLNQWLEHWCQSNPAFLGSNWKCGQEASIRVMHLALAARFLGQDSQPSSDLLVLLQAHLSRIHPTVSYAMAQDNNHGTSEAAALFIGGSMCQAAGIAQGAVWARDGRRLLENRAAKLIEPDGSFSQHSLNYHRLLLDTLCMVELWRRWQNLPAFTAMFLDRAGLATDWLFHLVDPQTGYGPNLGDNDGANLLPLTEANFRDYRPTVQLAMALFSNQLAYAHDGPHHLHLNWLEVEQPAASAPAPQSRHFPDGGYCVLRHGPWMALFRFPRDRFRPRHCDALHLDLWHGSRNLLLDAGSFSYNTEAPWQDYFPGNFGHNTVEFDGHDQMPVISRFLRGAWLNATDVFFSAGAGNDPGAGAQYKDWLGCRHGRSVQLGSRRVLVEDRISGFSNQAVLRWRLQPDQWSISGSLVSNQEFELKITADVEIKRMEIVEGWQSQYYMKKTPVPVLEVEVNGPGKITTEITIRQAVGKEPGLI